MFVKSAVTIRRIPLLLFSMAKVMNLTLFNARFNSLHLLVPAVHVAYLGKELKKVDFLTVDLIVKEWRDETSTRKR